MEVVYKKDMNNNYLVIKRELKETDDYKIKMICRNKIPGILNVSVRDFDGSQLLYYDISGKISYTNLFARSKIKAEDIKRFIFSLNELATGLKEYMLDMNKILLDFDYIFYDEKKCRTEFCYYPDSDRLFYEAIEQTLNKIIEVADHRDKETILLSYGLQQLGSSGENLTISELMEFVNENSTDHEDDTGQRETYDRMESDDVYINDIYENAAYADDINNEPDKKKRVNLFSYIKGFFSGEANKYKTADQISENTEIEYGAHRTENDSVIKPQEEIYQCEETVLLRDCYAQISVILKNTDSENADTIIPNDFPCIIGKSKRSADYIIDEKTVSRVHMKIDETEEGFFIEDLNSTNGTYLNEERLHPHEPTQINVGDKIKISNIEYIVC